MPTPKPHACGVGPDTPDKMIYQINTGGGFVPIEEAAEVLGLITLSLAGLTVPIVRKSTVPEIGVNVFVHKGRRWRHIVFSVFDMRTNTDVPTRIDLDYLGEEKVET